MVSSAELKLRRAMSHGELYGGKDPYTEAVENKVPLDVHNGGVSDKAVHDLNGNVQIPFTLTQRCNSLNELSGNVDKSTKKAQGSKFWQKFGKKGKRGLSKFLTSATYKIGVPRSQESDNTVTEQNDGRYSSADCHVPCVKENDKTDAYSRHTSSDSGFSSEHESLPSTPASSMNGDRVPGVCGIHNLGNTCYVNSVLQCLGHIDAFVEYFATDRHESDFTSKNKSKKNEALNVSEVTKKLAQLLKSLWSFGYSKELSKEFLEAVSNSSEQYKGSMQHDAQEFLLWLLNAVHEDLGRSSKKRSSRSVTIKRRKNYSEEELALMTLAAYTQSTGSFIQDLFQAQYRSSLNCPNCEKHSSTFDPFLCISLPIPQPETKPCYLTVVYNEKQREALKIGIKISTSSTVKELKTEISKLVNICENCLILVRIQDNGSQQCLKESNPAFSENYSDDALFAIEKPEKRIVRAPRKQTQGSGTSGISHSTNNDVDVDSVIVVVTNVEVRGHQSRRFGLPVALRVARDVTFKDLQLLIRREMGLEIREAFNEEARRYKLAVGLRMVHDGDGKEYLNAETEMPPLSLSMVRRRETSCVAAGYRHVSLIAEWESARGEWCFAKFGRGFARVDPSVKRVDDEYAKSQTVSLNECVALHTQEEELQYEDSWKCPNCKTELRKATKTLSLWSLPDVLVFHLKRFQQGNNWKGKVASLVDFPLENLDMSSHVAQRSKLSPRMMRRFHSMKKLRYHPPPKQEDCMYDLIAVCNHVGPYITSGHYTAHCKNSVDGNWYQFDDLIARPVPEEHVITKNAYLLFYQRRSGLSRATSVASFPMALKHWSLKMSSPTQRRSLHLDLETSIARLAEQDLKNVAER